MKALGKYLLILVICTSISDEIRAEEQTNNQEGEVIILDQITSNAKREEVQRYFGFDELLTNYMTLPYDVSTNVNEKGKFVDIGIYLFCLLPLILLFHVRKNKWLFYSFIVLILAYLLFCLSHSVLYDQKLAEKACCNTNWDAFMTADKRLDVAILAAVMQSADFLASPLNWLVYRFSGESDSITYPILIIIFCLSLALIHFSKNITPKKKTLCNILFVYSFMWLFLSGGIIWYAFLMIPLGLLIIGFIYSKSAEQNGPMVQFLKKMVPLVLVTWALLIFTLRISNITVSRQLAKEHLGKTILEANLLYYTTGLLNAEQTLDNSFKGLSLALNRINHDDKFIYMIGTSFSFDIKNSATRIFSDNTLERFLWLLKKHPDKKEFIRALKASNFKYILVDLYTDTLDQTPEKSLTTKYKLLLQTLYQNPSVGLIATNRIVEFTDVNGKKQQIGNVFGKIVYRGSYAVYEIL